MFKKIVSVLLMFGTIAINFGLMSPQIAMAGALTAISDTVSNLTDATVANHTIQFTTPTGVASGATIILTFDNSTSIPADLDYTDIDLKDDSTEITLAGTPSASTWGVVRTSATEITFTNGTTAVSSGSVINIEIGTNATEGATGDKQITNGSVGTTVLRITGNFGDTGALSMAIVADGVVSVTAEVLSSITFSVSDSAIYFGNLTASNACYAQDSNPGYVTCPTTSPSTAFTMGAGTNAPSGYTISVQGSTLTAPGDKTITALATNTASSPGTEQFGLRMTAAGGSGTVSVPYAAAGYAYTGTATTPATVATASAPSDTTTYSVIYLANISPLTEAGSYSTSHTYVATGNF